MAYFNVFKASGKAKCRKCGKLIAEDTSAFGCGYTNGKWQIFEQYHLDCLQNFVAEKLTKLAEEEITAVAKTA